jgi:predicted transposase YdaD
VSESDPPTRATPHDALFKLAFERPEHASGVLRTLLPAAAVARMDFSTLELVPGSFRDAELRDVETDLLYRVQLGGQPALVYVLLEHQSSVDPGMAWRLLRYVVKILESWSREHPAAQRLPAVLPVVVAHGERPWTAPTSLLALYDLDEPTRSALEPWLVNFRFVLDDLAVQSSEALRARPEASALARLTLFLLQRGRESPDLLSELRSWVEVLRQVGASGGDDLVAIVVYSWVVADVPPAELRAFLRDELHTNPDEVMGAAEKFLARIGPTTWLQRGREEGKAEGKDEVVLRLLARRFGPLAPVAEQRVRAASTDALDAMADRVLDAERLEDVLGS